MHGEMLFLGSVAHFLMVALDNSSNFYLVNLKTLIPLPVLQVEVFLWQLLNLHALKCNLDISRIDV